jgi:hypothetical protein
MRHNYLLLVDLDGVIVFEHRPQKSLRREIILLHTTLSESVSSLSCPILFLTHRSRAEAEAILIGMDLSFEISIIAAEDLYACARRRAGLRELFRWGLRKSWIIPELEKQYGINRDRFAFIDDNAKNANDLLGAGIGLALLAPSEISEDGLTLTTFEMAEATQRILEWESNGKLASGLVQLAPKHIPIAEWSRTGINVRKQSRHAFNLGRRVMRFFRNLILR